MDTESRRPNPYVWVTWITGLLAGVDKCQWKIWKKAHFRYVKRVDPKGDFDLSEWTKQHDAMTDARVQRLRQAGFKVRVEDENAFKLDGKLATLAGKSDIVAIHPTGKYAVIIDEKSGKMSPAHRWQVIIYMWAEKLNRLKDHIVSGEVEYRNTIQQVRADELNDESISKIREVMNTVGGPDEPHRVPSRFECQYCDILACPDRYSDTPSTTVDVTDHF